MSSSDKSIFPSAQDDAEAAKLFVKMPQTLSSYYRLAYADGDFLKKDELRPVRLQMELLKAELLRTKKIRPMPVLVFSKIFWSRVIDFDFLVEKSMISSEDVKFFEYVETAEDAFEQIISGTNRRKNGMSK